MMSLVSVMDALVQVCAQETRGIDYHPTLKNGGDEMLRRGVCVFSQSGHVISKETHKGSCTTADCSRKMTNSNGNV